MIIKPFGEEGISMLQGNRKDVPITDYICALLEEEGGVIPGDFIDEVQKATIQNGKVKRIPYNAKVVDLINDITYEYESKDRKIVELWAVLMKEGDFHMLHNHQEVGGISGGLYLKIPEMKQPQGNINWVSDNKVFSWSPKDGDYFVWPSNVIHGVYPFKGSGSRIMISWNSV